MYIFDIKYIQYILYVILYSIYSTLHCICIIMYICETIIYTYSIYIDYIYTKLYFFIFLFTYRSQHLLA